MNRQQDMAPMSDWLEQAWFQRYLDRQLDEGELAWFEAYLLQRPALLDRLEDELALRDAIATSGLADHNQASPQAATAPIRRRRQRSGWLAGAVGMAAGVALSIGVVQLAGRVGDASLSQPPRLVYEAMRGAGYQVREEAGDRNSPMVLVEVGLVSGMALQSVHVQLDHGAQRELPDARISNDGFLAFLMPRDWTGRAKLRIRFDDPVSTAPELVIDLDHPADVTGAR